MTNKNQKSLLKENLSEHYIWADWPAPDNVKALVTTRKQGVSTGHFAHFNLASHVDDDGLAVMQNRQILKNELQLSQEPFWLNQTHSTDCVPWQNYQPNSHFASINADAAYALQREQACIVLTADCLPILFTNSKGNWVAACHAGWRGLANGVVQNTVKQYLGNPNELIAWIGPAISQKHFEVGQEVKALFVSQSADYLQCFQKNEVNKYQFDFILLAQLLLKKLGIKSYGGNLCSYSDVEHFYSFRRDQQTGRMASLIWFE